MKKYLILTILLSLPFLWLGNYSFGQSEINNGTPVSLTPSNTFGNGWNGTPPPSAPSTPLYPTNPWAWTPSNNAIAIPKCNVVASDLFDDPNAQKNTFWCACKKWFGRSTSQTKPKLCQPCSDPDVCCGTKLNTSIPFIGNCIETSSQASGSTINESTAFPILVWSLIKIVVSVILITSFILIIVAGVMIATGDSKWGKDMIIKVAIGLALLWASGVILRLINPNFFG